jgi:hypothetical protein
MNGLLLGCFERLYVSFYPWISLLGMSVGMKCPLVGLLQVHVKLL